MYFAEVSGLSLRTIQRIGKTGNASQKNGQIIMCDISTES